MNIRKSYWIISLSLLLSFSLALPYCCHADISELFSQHQEMASHASHGQQSSDTPCDCGHEFVKDHKKTKKVANSQALLVSSAVVLSGHASFLVSIDSFLVSATPPGILSNSGPPIYLLNSVFLN